MACPLRRRCRRILRVKNISCWVCIFITAVILISSYIGNLNHGEVLSDTVSERWRMERLHIVIRPELETAIIQPKLRHNSICHKNMTPDILLHEEPLQILILVTSAPHNVEARSAIRYSWANESLLPTEVEVFFILGTTLDENVEEIVKKEAEKFNDIIMEDFIDSYDNLTYKTLFALKWATRNCYRVTHLMKTDDDMLIIPKNLMLELIKARDILFKGSAKERNLVILKGEKQHLLRINNPLSKENAIEEIIHKKNENVNKSNLRHDYPYMTELETTNDEDKIGEISGGYILGKILQGVRPYRDRNSKWYIPYTLYNEKYLPDFASGTAYIITNGNKYCGAIKPLFINALKIMPALPLEDVFITGVVRAHIDVPVMMDKGRFSSSIPVLFPWTLSRLATCYYSDMIAVHGFKPNDLITAWKKLQDLTKDECNSISGYIQKYIYALLAIFEMPNG